MDGPDRFRYLLDRLHREAGRQVVVLVDEYDKPILDVLDDPERADANREYLRGLYGVIKDCAGHVRFVFVTGVSMFTKVNLFSGLNNLRNISLDPIYATICGYTDRDLDTVFAPELEGLNREETIRSGNALLELLAAEDFEGFGERLKSYLAGVPHQWCDSSPIDRFEAHYASMLYLCFRAVGADLTVEDASSRDRGEPVHLVAAAFGRGQRNLLAVRAERG